MNTQNMKIVFKRPESLIDVPTHYCPGCQHGVIHRMIAEQLDEYNLREKTIAVSSIGCSVFLYNYLDVDTVEAPHGRATAAATGIKRTLPENFVFTYQGDGDLASIGIAETIHAASRGEKFIVFFVNNAVFGMTGGQMAPTTLEGQVTTTTPYGRDVGLTGLPMKVSEIISAIDGSGFVARCAVDTIKNINQTKRAMKRAIEYQLNGWGFSLVEILSTCPTNWKMTPAQSNKHLVEKMFPYYPLGVFKDAQAAKAATTEGGN